jgi:glutamyl-tRNA synthetase
LEDYWEKKGVKDFRNKFTSKYIEKALSLEQERLKKFSKIGELTEFFFVPEFLINDKLLAWKRMDMDTAKNNLKSLLKELEKIIDNDWSIDNLNDIIVAFLKNNNLSIGEYLWPMRVALTGQKASPGPFEVAWALGKEESVKRIQNAIGE